MSPVNDVLLGYYKEFIIFKKHFKISSNFQTSNKWVINTDNLLLLFIDEATILSHASENLEKEKVVPVRFTTGQQL